MKVGDLVRLSPSKTRKDFTYEDMIGLIVDMATVASTRPAGGYIMCSVNFGGEVHDLNMTDLVTVKPAQNHDEH
jgi:hypothetical protein